MIFLILGLAFILRIININQSLWLDEATQAVLSSKSLYFILFERSGDFHPPFYYLLIHFWLLVNQSEIWLRLPSVLFGVATVGVLYLFAKQLVNEKFAVLSATALAVAPYHIYYSQELRMYAAVAFFATLSTYLIYKLDHRSTFLLFGYFLSMLLLLLTHYMGFFMVVVHVIYVFTKKRQLKFVYSILLMSVMVLWLLWFPQFLLQLKSGVNVDQYLPGWRELLTLSWIKAVPLTFVKFSIGRIDFENEFLYGSIALIILLLFGYFVVKGMLVAKTKSIYLLLFWFLIPIFLSWIISFQIPLNQPFRLLFVIPAFYLLTALGVWNLGRFKAVGIAAVVAISLSGLFLYYVNPKFWREDWRGATSFVNSKVDENTKVVFAWPVNFDPYIWYGGKDGKGVVKNFPAVEDNINTEMGYLVAYDKIYYFEYLQALSDPKKLIQKWFFENGYVLYKTYDYSGVGFIGEYHKK